jgi:hypothetical protein
MAVQSDLYVAALPALIVGILADVFVAVMGDRARGGTPFATFGFLVPALFTAGLILTYVIQNHGAGWPADVIMGTPILAGVAGLFIAFCYDQPLAKA